LFVRWRASLALGRVGVSEDIASPAMRIGLALPQYDYSVFGESPLQFDTIVAHARVASEAGYTSLWLSDHLFLDIEKYGGSPGRHGVYEPLVTLAALSRLVPDVRLGTLVLLEALRPAAVLAKALASLDRICDGRLDVGLGAGWYEPEYQALGLEMPRPGERLDRLREAVDVVTGLLGGGPLDYDGRHHRARAAVNLPPATQLPRPLVFVGGKGDRLLQLVAEHADGWNTCWAWTTADYRERLGVLEAACERVGRDPGSIWRSLGLYALCGEDQHDLERRFERLKASTPAGVLDGVTLDQWRRGRLVGTVQEVREQAREWEGLGVETIIVGAGALPFQVGHLDDVLLLGEALCS
jgi:alkanesulfonate monooxygenase SsuD/methylene tetrahydromethanopterin reductase-like flavin-dependent oxidoreductase (luciferase family)